MSSPVLLGPNGEPISVASKALDTIENTHRKISHQEALAIVRRGMMVPPEALLDAMKRRELDGAIYDDVEGTAVEKAGGKAHDTRRGVFASGASMMNPQDRNRGKPKPTPVTWETLRLMGNRAEWVRAIIKTRKNQIGDEPWSIKPKDPDDKSPSTERLIKRFEKMLKHPQMYGSRPTSMSWRHFIGMILEDLLVLDAGCFEKERTYGGNIVALYPVDGATIRPNIDEHGGHYTPDAYVQVVEGMVMARFGMEQLAYVVDNPQTDVRFCGYGMSPLEHLIITVTAELQASKYNSSYFEKGAVPEGMLNLGEDAAPEDVDAFRLYWMNEIMGRPWAIPIMAGKGAEWMQWRDSHRDMQFMEYQSWLLKKACAVYQIAPQEVGVIEDVNRSTAESQEDSNESKSVGPILSLIADVINVEVIGPHGEGLEDWIEFEFEGEDESPQEVNERFQPMVEAGAATRAEWRSAQGMDSPEEGTPGGEGLDMFLTGTQLQPLPTKEDAELLSTAKQQEREDQQQAAEQEGQGPTSGMEWKPGDPSDPALHAAQAEHDDEGGNGPTPDQIRKTDETPDLVSKTHPAGRDRAPAQTEREDDLIGVLTSAQEQLRNDLGDILGLPPVDVEALV